MKVLVTGASGFVGRHLVRCLQTAGHTVVTAGWSSKIPLDYRVALSPQSDWSGPVSGCYAVVHAGGLAHVVNSREANASDRFTQMNTDGTLALAQASAAAGVTRFVFISSIAALGDFGADRARETQPANPDTPYGRSKLAAELGLADMASRTDMTIASLRPPLIYGADAGGRFGQMMAWCDRRLPLPLGNIDNQRSYLSVDNLADAVRALIEAPTAVSGVFNIADAEPLSTPQLLRLIGDGLGKPARLFSVPGWALGAMRKVGLAQPIDKLSGTLLLDTGKLQQALGWNPPIAVHDGILKAAREYRQSRSH